MNSYQSQTNLIQSIEENVFMQLTEHADEFKSSAYLFNNYANNKTYVPNDNKKLFVTICELLDTKYNNVYKTYKNGMCYLCFYTDKSKLENALNQISSDMKTADNQHSKYYMDIEQEFKKINNCDVVEYMVNNM